MSDVVTRYGWKDARASCAHPYLVPALREALARLAPRRVLDLGCGNGHVTGLLAVWGFDVVGVDAAEDGLAIARSTHPDVRFELGSVYERDLPARLGPPFDLVVSLEVIEHLFRPRALFERAHELLKPGGSVLLSTPYHGYVKNLALSLSGKWDTHFHVDVDGGHIKFFSPRTLSKMASDVGFQTLRLRGVGRLPFVWKSIVAEFRKR